MGKNEVAATPAMPGDLPKMRLTDNARITMRERYLRKNEEGEVVETEEERFWAMSWNIAEQEKPEDQMKFAREFYGMMARGEFMPNSPAIMNAGRGNGNALGACFVLPIEDSIEGIFSTVKNTALVQKAGGGTGFSFDRLRPTGDYINSSSGNTSGPLSFWKVLAEATNSIQQGCFVGGTLIGMPGRNKQIQDIKRGDIVYSFDISKGCMSLSRAACDAFKTKKGAEVWELTTDKGLTLFATPDHLMLTRSGSYKELSSLKSGQRLMPLSRYTKGNDLMVTLQDGKDTRAHEHRLLGKYLYPEYDAKINSIHHKNGNHQDNSPENLQLMTDGEHATHHGKIKGAFYSEGQHGTKNGMHRENFWSTASEEEKTRYRHAIGRGAREDNVMKRPGAAAKHPLFNSSETKLLAKRGKIVASACMLREKGLPTTRDAWAESTKALYNTYRYKPETVVQCFGSWESFEKELSGRNHVVVSVGFSHREDVWDFEVEGTHNFCVVGEDGRGVVAHNSMRRGANMGMMTITHPDVLKFIYAKQDLTAFTNYNVSVKIPSAWMEAYKANPNTPHVVTNFRNGKKFYLPKSLKVMTYSIQELIPADVQVTTVVDTTTGKVSYEAAGKDVWTMKDVFGVIVDCAWRTGEPGLFFIDEANKYNPTPQVGAYESTNPCGEQILLPYESCNLGSINVAKFSGQKESDFDWERLNKAIKTSVRFLDNVVDASPYPIPEIAQMCHDNRKIGLGIMGFADALYGMGIPYNSEEALSFGSNLMRFLNEESIACSSALAEEKGVFPNWEGSLWQNDSILGTARKMRNAVTTTVAPTGTISIFANCSGGIEPLFSLSFIRQVLNGKRLKEVNGHFVRVAKEQGFYTEELMEKILANGTLHGIDGVPEAAKKLFVCTHDISPEWHVRMQSAFQEHCGSSISKTVNLPHDATREDVEKAYILAFDLKCKGTTVYRDGCRDLQPMSLKKEEKKVDAVHESKRHAVEEWKPRRPIKTAPFLPAIRMKQSTPLGTMHVTITVDPSTKHEVEIFAQLGKAGDTASSDLEAICRMVSMYLRLGGSIVDVIDQFDGIGSNISIPTKDGKVQSLADGLAKSLRVYHMAKGSYGLDAILLGKADLSKMSLKTGIGAILPGAQADVVPPKAAASTGAGKCSSCGGKLVKSQGCLECTECGFSKCG